MALRMMINGGRDDDDRNIASLPIGASRRGPDANSHDWHTLPTGSIIGADGTTPTTLNDTIALGEHPR